MQSDAGLEGPRLVLRHLEATGSFSKSRFYLGVGIGGLLGPGSMWDPDSTCSFGLVSPSTGKVQISNARRIHDCMQTHQASPDRFCVT